MSAASSLNSSASSYYLQSLLALSGAAVSPSAGAGGTNSTAGASGSTATISGPGQLLSALQQLQTQDPSSFSQIVSQIAGQVQTAAQQQGQTGVGQFLTNLASTLQNVANTGDLSELESHKGHHGHHAHGTYNSQGQAATTTSSTGSQSSSSNGIQQLFSSIVQQINQAIGSPTTASAT